LGLGSRLRLVGDLGKSIRTLSRGGGRGPRGAGCGRIGTGSAVTALWSSGTRCGSRGSISRASLTAGLTHQSTALDARDVAGLELMHLTSRLGEGKLNILTLDKVLVLRIRDTNRRVVNKDILRGQLTITYGNKAIAGLIVEPLHLANEAIRLNFGCFLGRTHVITQLYSIE
jgi:hypothetical protein